MSDAEERLAGLDPAANQPYRHADLDDMISRIVATPARSQSTHWQRLQARLAGGLIAATLATALALVATQGTPSLPALALQRSLSPSPSTDLSTAAPMNAYENVHLSAGPTISTSAPSVESYRLSLPASAKAETVRLAAVFGVSGTPREDDGIWTVRSSSRPVLNYDEIGLPEWSYSSTSPAVGSTEESGSTSVAVPSHATVESDVQRYLNKLGFHFTLSSPNFSTAPPTGAPLTVSSETASYSVIVDGTTTDEPLNFTVNSANKLLYANGPAFRVGSTRNYPLRSPLDGVEALSATEKQSFASSATTPAAKATVTSDVVSLAAYRLKNGTVWLLPLYTYSGSVTGASSDNAVRTWKILAIEPTYVKGSSAASDSLSN